ncbi:AAA family ATPase [Fervidobacterium sp.]
MFVKKVHIDGFGKFVNAKFTFKPGLNIIYGPNESGKTTLAKFLLYSLSKSKNEVLKFKPWGHDTFGGYVETSDGLYMFGGQEGEVNKYEVSVLESVAFLMEDDDLETVKVDRNILEGSLRKKTEKTEEGRILKDAIKRIEVLDLSVCLDKVSHQLKEIDSQISTFEKNIEEKNIVFLEVRKLNSELKELEIRISNLAKSLEAIRESKAFELSERIVELRKKLENVDAELARYRWLDSVDMATVDELQKLLARINSLKVELERLEGEEEVLKETLKKKTMELDEKLRMLGAVSTDDLESVGLRLKHLSLLSKMYGERVNIVNNEEPLWKVFLENENILEQAEEEEQKYKNLLAENETSKLHLQDEIEKHEQIVKYSKDLSIVSSSAGVVLFVLGLLFKNLSLFMYVPAAIFLAIAVFFIFNWKKKSTIVNVLQERLLEISMKSIQQPQIWKVLSSYGINNIKQLRKKYTEFLEWKAQNAERQRQLSELKEIEQEIIKELSKFGVTGAAQMIVSAVENLQRTFNQVQEIVYEKESLDRKLTQIQGEYLALQKEYKNISETVSVRLQALKITQKDIESFKSNFERYQELRSMYSILMNDLERAEEERKNEDLEPRIMELKTEIDELKRRKDSLEQELQIAKKRYDEINIDFKELRGLIGKRDELKLKSTIVSNLIQEIPILNEFLKKKFESFVDSYHRLFSEEFGRFFTKVSALPKNFVVMPDLSIKIVVEGDMKNVDDYLSGSTKDLLIFAIKNALYKTFYDGNLPLVIDNTLIRFDDERLKRICDYLREESAFRQILLLTSDKRILQIFENEKQNVINLEG